MPAQLLMEVLVSIAVVFGLRRKARGRRTDVVRAPCAARRCVFAIWMWALRIEICAKALAYGNVRLAWGAISGIEVEKLSW
ncbi:MAG TPA: hypothetical protein VH063_14555 [Gaiellaceae bacterium]|nr:hypothetical protein [Gaiellaceae bacterium]